MKTNYFIRLTVCVISVISLLTLFFSGCTKSNESEKASTNSVIKLKYSTDLPEIAAPTQIANYFLDYIEGNSNGRVKFERFYAGALGSSEEQTNLVKTGVVDVGGGSITEAEFPLHSCYPQFVMGNPKAGVDFIQNIELEILESSKLLQQEWTDNNIKFLGGLPSGENGFIAKFEFKTLADLKGKKLGVDSGRNQKIFSALGPVGVIVPIPEMYEALSRGLVDAATLSLAGMVQMGWYEVCKCYLSDKTYSSAGGQTHLPFVNLNTWNKLPEDIKNIFLEAAEATTQYALTMTEKDDLELKQKMIDKGLTTGVLPEEDRNIEYKTFLKIWYTDSMENARKIGKSEQAQVIWDVSSRLINMSIPE